MEEIKTKKKLNKKPLIICLVLALVFGIVGFMDIKSNAAESQCSIEFVMPTYGADGNSSHIEKNIVTGQDDMVVYYWQSHNQPTTETSYCCVYVVSDYPMTLMEYDSYDYGETFFPDGPYSSVEIYVNGHKKYVRSAGSILDRPNNAYLGLEFEWNNCKKITKWYNPDDFYNALINGTIETVVDVENLPIDDDMSVIQNLLYNIIRNEKPSENDTTGMGIIKDVEYYEYLTWTNTENLPIQVEYVPIVQVYSGLFNEKFKKEYYGEWTDFEILSVGTNSYTKRTDSEYLFENDSVGKDFEKDILDKYVEWDDNTYLFYGYRMRYVDENNFKCSPWVYAVPRENGTYYSYIEYSDNSTSNDENITGTDNTYENIEDIEDAKTDIDKENEVIQNMNNANGNIDTSQASNWLYSVVDFIKTTPSMVGTVLAFLPQPILYGMNVTIFLGCIASAIAILKALI